MNNVSLSYFLDFVLKSGTPKLTVVRGFKYRDEYDPLADFYRPFRDKLGELCTASASIGTLQPWASGAPEKKRTAYLAIAAGLKRFVGRRNAAWFEPPRGTYTIGDITVNVNPELGVHLQGVPHIIKVYWKEDPRLTRVRVQVILHLMAQALRDRQRPCTFGVLDVRRGRLHTAALTAPGIAALLNGEAASFAAMHAAV
jgi:hypothetical protein